jgi:hypothetical protein
MTGKIVFCGDDETGGIFTRINRYLENVLAVDTSGSVA